MIFEFSERRNEKECNHFLLMWGIKRVDSQQALIIDAK